MNCKFINVLMFTAGAAIGSLVTWKVVKGRYERIAQEEIESTKEAFLTMLATRDEDVYIDEPETEEEIESEDQYKGTTHIDWSLYEDLKEEFSEEDREDYANLSNTYTSEKGGAEDVGTDPYVISPYDFGEFDDYHQIELTYYEGDDTLEDSEYNIVTDRDELLGPKALLTFGEYEDDSVFVRNERLRTDFQILKDYRSYAEARSIGPRQVDDE